MSDVLAKIKPQAAERKWATSGLTFLCAGVLLNAIVWAGALLYLKGAEASYVSKWGVLVLGGNADVSLSLPGTGSASADAGGRTKTAADARTDYVYIATSPDVLNEAAKQAGIEGYEFGRPEIVVDKDTAIMSFSIEGESPELAQEKGQALYTVLNERVEQLRTGEVDRRNQDNQVALKRARQKVDAAQEELANYLASSGFNSDQQLEGLATGIEALRQQRSQYSAQAAGLNGRIAQINTNVDPGGQQDIADSYSLQSDSVYQQLFDAYGRLSAEFSEIAGQLGPQHPLVVSKRAELGSAQTALQQRGSFLLGRSVDQATLARIAPLGIDPQSSILRGELFRESVVNQADRESLISQNQTLAGEINQMEVRLGQLSQEKFVVDRLRQNLQLAEAIFTSTLARLDLNAEDIYSLYPPIQLVTEPSLPNEGDRVSPSAKTVLLGALAGSFVITLGLLLFWYEKRERDPLENEQLPSWLSS